MFLCFNLIQLFNLVSSSVRLHLTNSSISQSVRHSSVKFMDLSTNIFFLLSIQHVSSLYSNFLFTLVSSLTRSLFNQPIHQSVRETIFNPSTIPPLPLFYPFPHYIPIRFLIFTLVHPSGRPSFNQLINLSLPPSLSVDPFTSSPSVFTFLFVQFPLPSPPLFILHTLFPCHRHPLSPPSLIPLPPFLRPLSAPH